MADSDSQTQGNTQESTQGDTPNSDQEDASVGTDPAQEGTQSGADAAQTNISNDTQEPVPGNQ